MSGLLRRPTKVICFFCQSEVQPRDPRSFRCSQCSCWNRYDARGEIVSDEPAMHDESMNTRSFAKRGETTPFYTYYPFSLTRVGGLYHSLAKERQIPINVRSRHFLSHLPNQPNAYIKPPLQLFTSPRCMWPFVSRQHRTLLTRRNRTGNTLDSMLNFLHTVPLLKRGTHRYVPRACPQLKRRSNGVIIWRERVL